MKAILIVLLMAAALESKPKVYLVKTVAKPHHHGYTAGKDYSADDADGNQGADYTHQVASQGADYSDDVVASAEGGNDYSQDDNAGQTGGADYTNKHVDYMVGA